MTQCTRRATARSGVAARLRPLASFPPPGHRLFTRIPPAPRPLAGLAPLLTTLLFLCADLFRPWIALAEEVPGDRNAAGELQGALAWFNTERLNIFIPVTIFTGIILYMIRQAAGKNLFIRSMPGLDALEEAIGRATEMGKPVLYVPGIDEATNIQTIYSMIILNHVAKRVAQYDTPLIVPVGKAAVMPLADETVKAGYMAAGRPEGYNPDNVRFLSDEQFAFTAAVNGIMNREKPAANIYLGSFYAESLVLAETGFATGAIQIAGTANIHQLPFFVVACDYALVGEEFYAATAYLCREPNLVGTLKATDYMKVLLILLLVVGFILETAGYHGLTQWMVPR